MEVLSRPSGVAVLEILQGSRSFHPAVAESAWRSVQAQIERTALAQVDRWYGPETTVIQDRHAPGRLGGARPVDRQGAGVSDPEEIHKSVALLEPSSQDLCLERASPRNRRKTRASGSPDRAGRFVLHRPGSGSRHRPVTRLSQRPFSPRSNESGALHIMFDRQRLAMAARGPRRSAARAASSSGRGRHAGRDRGGPCRFTQNGGTWPSGHVQGVAVDVAGRLHLLLVHQPAREIRLFSGKLIGTLVGWTGHLGDLDFNPADGKVYGSLEYKEDKAFYIAVIDVSRLDRVGVEASKTEIFRTVYLPEVVKDYAADLNGDGVFEGDDGKFKGDVVASPDHRYDCSGIDGVSFGPEFGRTDGKRYLTVAYGVYGNTSRADNDHQVLLQYDIADWAGYARPLTEAAPHHSGPEAVHDKVFVRTGNTRYGVQNLAYDEASRRWFMGVYQGQKPTFPNYLLFAVEARERPVRRRPRRRAGAGRQGLGAGAAAGPGRRWAEGRRHGRARMEPEGRRGPPAGRRRAVLRRRERARSTAGRRPTSP